jgi:hypothetical protein
MKKWILIALTALLCLSVFGQAKKPTLMVFPSDVWCNKNGFMLEFDNQGTIELIPNFKLAMQSDSDLMNVISRINTLMADRGFPLEDLSASLKSMERTSALNRTVVSKTSGAHLAETPLDQLKRQAKADIILELDWTVNTIGPKKSITYNLRGLDAYTNKQIAGAQGTGTPSFSVETERLLEEAVLVNMDNFTARLQAHFDDLFANGREVTVDIQIFDNDSKIDLETEWDGKELAEIIDDWMAKNTVKHRYGKSTATENFVLYEQVRIPLYGENEMPMDTEMFVRNLMKTLRSAPYNITSKVEARGLGECMLIIGEK